MKWKTAALAALLTIAASTGAMAYDMNTLAEKTLPKSFKYMAIPGEQTMEFNGAEVPYKMGQLQITLKRSQKFYSGYIIRTTLPPEVADAMHPYFRLNPTVTEWRGLAQLNRALMNPSSQLRKGIDKTLLNLAVNALGQVAKEDVKVEISDIEPFRRLDAGEAYVYTAGGRIVYDAQGLLMQMYARSYFFLGENGLEVMMLLAPDEGKDILVYAIDDLAKAAAKEDLLGAGGYADISVILGRQEMGLEKDFEAGESEADEQKEQEQITQKAQ